MQEQAKRTGSVALFLSLALGLPLSAQTPPPLREKVEVTRTSLDFVATDSKGNPIHGLDPSTITLLADGKPVEVTNLSEYRREGAAGASQTASPPDRITFFFDDSSLTTPTRRRIILAAEEFARKVVPGGTQVEIVVFNRSLDHVLAATNDLNKVTSAFELISKRAPNGAMREGERRRLQNYITTMIADGEAAARSDSPPVNLALILAGVRPYAEERAKEVDETNAALIDYLTGLNRVEGRKAVILASESYPTRPGSDLYQFMGSIVQRLASDSTSVYTREARKNSEYMDEGRYLKARDIRSVAELANSVHAVLYGINPSLPGDSSGSGTVEQTAPGQNGGDFAAGMGGIDGLQILATATGGLALVGMQPAAALTRIHNDLGSYYSLAYRGGERSRKIELRSSVPGVKIRYAQGMGATQIVQTAETHEPIDLDDFSGDNKLNIALARGDSTSQPEGRKVQLKVMIPVDNLLLSQEASGEIGGSFSIYMQFKKRDGSELSSINKQSHQLRWTAQQAAAAKGKTITFVSDVMVREGRDQVVVRVVDDNSKTTGFGAIDLSGS